MANALPPEGEVISLEINPGRAAMAQASIDTAGASDRVRILIGPALDALARFKGEGTPPFDFVFIDDDHRRDEYVRAALDVSRSGTIIIVDNVVRVGKIADPTTTTSTRAECSAWSSSSRENRA